MKTLLIFGLMLAAVICSADPGTVTLRDGTTLDNALIVRLNPATYIVQTDDKLLELSEDELAPASLQGHNFQDKRPPVITQHFDEVHADGTATRYWTLPITNHGRKAMTEIRMGLAFWERAVVDQNTFVDNRGMTLVSSYDPPREKWASQPDKIIRHTLAMNTPLAPGESMTFTGKQTTPRIHETKEGLLYRHNGGYSEDRLLWLKVRLPLDAQIVRMSPVPSVRFEHEGCQYLMWKHYYKKDEMFPLEVIYTLD